ncbi:MAG: cupin domain-containing protein [Pseudomonadota bacterium]
MSDFFFNFADAEAGTHRQLAPGIDTQLFVGEQAMFSVVSFAPGARGSVHEHAEEQWGVLLEGEGVRVQDGVEVPVGAGDFWRTPPGVAHGFIAGPQGAKVLDVFALPREAYRREGAGFS